jgi:hypothetical protein
MCSKDPGVKNLEPLRSGRPLGHWSMSCPGSPAEGALWDLSPLLAFLFVCFLAMKHTLAMMGCLATGSKPPS